jgi:hypothetical protein
MDAERREYIRVREKLVTFVKQTATGKVHRALTRDISGVGICLITNEPLEAGAPLEFELKLPEFDRAVPFTGHVAWSKVMNEAGAGFKEPMREIGIRFVNIAPKDLTLIRQHAAMNAVPPAG